MLLFYPYAKARKLILLGRYIRTLGEQHHTAYTVGARSSICAAILGGPPASTVLERSSIDAVTAPTKVLKSSPSLIPIASASARQSTIFILSSNKPRCRAIRVNAAWLSYISISVCSLPAASSQI